MFKITTSKALDYFKLPMKLWSSLSTRNIRSLRHNCNIPAVVMNNGNEMPILGFGTWSSTKDFLVLEKPKDDQTPEKASQSKVTTAVGLAIDAGYRHIDCAHLHNNEKAIGEVIKCKIRDGVVKRDDLFITSKLWNTFHDPEQVCLACAQTLSDLNLDYLDMYLMHSPMSFQYANDLLPLTPEGHVAFGDVNFCETWKAMEELVDTKMCKNIGISNFNQEQIECLLGKCRIAPQTLQIEVHPYLTQKELIHFAKWNDICITSYAAMGLDNVLFKDYKVLQLAKSHERSPAQILLRYQVQLGLATIVQSTNRQHITENINIFDFELCREDMQNLESLNHNLGYFEFSGAYGHPYHPFEKKNKQ